MNVMMAVAAFALASTIPAGSWRIDPARSEVGFTVTKFGKEVVEGRFHRFKGSVVYDPREPRNNSLQWIVLVSSVDTGEPDRDRTLQGPDFFDSARYPNLVFSSDRIHELPDGRIHIRGRLTIRDRSLPIVVTARPVGSNPPAFETQFVIDRHHFGVSGGSVSRHGISDRVRVHLRMVGVQR